MAETQIVALVPADHWFVVYRNPDGTLFATRLAVWCIARDSDGDRVCGIDMAGEGAGGIPEELGNVVCYAHETDIERVLAGGAS